MAVHELCLLGLIGYLTIKMHDVFAINKNSYYFVIIIIIIIITVFTYRKYIVMWNRFEV